MSNKYHAVRIWSELCGRVFASKLEAKRGEELRLMEIEGEITGLKFQTTFILSSEPKITITLDFEYWEKGRPVHEDTKGVLTRDTRTKLAWLKEKFGIEVKLIREVR